MTQGAAWVRARGEAWGNQTSRVVLQEIAEEIADRTGHRVVCIEAMRSDGFLEFVGVAAEQSVRDKILGLASALVPDYIMHLGIPMGAWRFIPDDVLDDEMRSWLEEFGHRGAATSPRPAEAWHPDDQLVRLLENEAGQIRATLYLDEPVTGLRPTPETIAAIDAAIGVLYDPVVSVVERERYREEVRMLAQVRSALASVRTGLGLTDFLDEVTAALVGAMKVHAAYLVLEGGDVAGLEHDTTVLVEHMREAWRRRSHVIVEPEQSWGPANESVSTSRAVRHFMEQRGLGSMLLLPIGFKDDYLGTLALGRDVGVPLWTDSEVHAATTVTSDLAGLLADSRLVERERELNSELRATIDYRRDMMNTLAHELRNPVSVMWNHLDLLRLEEEMPEAAQWSLNALDRAAHRIEEMIEDLMALATVSDVHVDIAEGPVDLSQLTQDCCAFLEPLAVGGDLHLTTDIGDGLLVRGAEKALQRLVGNLVSNAIKYTPGGGAVTLKLARAESAGRDGVRLTCADTGIGIDPAEHAQLFTPFFRSASPQARQRPGTGLGLAIVDQVVKRYGGTLDVVSEVGVGTTFDVWLPA